MDHTPNAVTLAAMKEVQDVIDGKIPAAMTIDVSGCTTYEEVKAAIHAAFEAEDEDED
jgi:aerobic-type carbon monoxide dehydrogenase small subunit (CoxS/CutS family)